MISAINKNRYYTLIHVKLLCISQYYNDISKNIDKTFLPYKQSLPDDMDVMMFRVAGLEGSRWSQGADAAQWFELGIHG